VGANRSIKPTVYWIILLKARPNRAFAPGRSYRPTLRLRCSHQGSLAQEVAAINEHAEKLNSEMSDALSFQARMD
jgi:hypothetical protein